MNKVILIGRLATDVEMRATASGIAQANFRLAVNRRYKNAEGKYDADFLTVVCWRETATLAGKYLKKGDRCGVVGAVQVRTYSDHNGRERSVTEIVAEEVEFLQERRREAVPEEAQRPQRAEQTQMGFTEVDDDELPF